MFFLVVTFSLVILRLIERLCYSNKKQPHTIRKRLPRNDY